MGVASWQDIKKEQLKDMKSDAIANGSVFTDFCHYSCMKASSVLLYYPSMAGE